MKKILSLLICLMLLYSLNAQLLYSTTSVGGTNNGGVICKLDTSTKKLTTAFSFDAPDIGNPVNSNLVQATDGKLYGVTSAGGSTSAGGIFSYNPATGTYTKLKEFDGSNSAIGSGGYGGLMQASNGKLYGMTAFGGANGLGVIYSFDPATSIYTKVKDFDGANGASAYGNLVQASDGKLYGMTYTGGSSNKGVIFSFNPTTNIYTKLYDFDGTNGGASNGSLIQATNGKLYGMTYEGGAIKGGVIFSFDPATNVYTKLWEFDGINGYLPRGNLVQASNGKLYGTTTGGGSNNYGVIFSFNISNNGYARLFDFDIIRGQNPNGGLIQASNGKLYGMTNNGGSNFRGVIFSFNPNNNVCIKEKDLNALSGCNPLGSLMQAGNGKLYGMTYVGGYSDIGVIFSFDPATSVYVKTKDFGTNNTGYNIVQGAIRASDGKLYGMTHNGGSNAAGVLYSYNTTTNTYTKLKDFDGVNGANPYGTLVQASNGKLYGMTWQGGSQNWGVIFSFDISTNTYTKLKDFDSTNGSHPYGSLIQATDGKLYGMTNTGGSVDVGVIFSFNLANNTYTKIKDFDANSGYWPTGSLLQAGDGKLYGMTSIGGSYGEGGTVFSFNPTNLAYNKLIDFENTNNSTNGMKPNGSLIQANDGQLYGMNSFGGSGNSGVIFSINPVSNVFTKLKAFDVANGGYPYGTLVQASNGKLYGITSGGGRNNMGVAFSFNPVDLVYSKLADFNGTNGRNPQYTSFTKETGCGTYYKDADGDGYGNTNKDTTACNQPVGYVTVSGDCNDADKTVYPGAPEIMDGKDNNCNGVVDEKALQIKVADLQFTEGNINSKTVKFKVTLSAASAQTVTVQYKTVNGTATEPSDYGKKSGTIIFDPGVKTRYISVSIKGDTQVESDETFSVVLSNPVQATIADGTAIGTILNDDGTAKMIAKQSNSNSVPSITASPNPANNVVQVQLSGYSGKVMLQVTDLSSKVLKQVNLQSANGKMLQHQLSVADIAAGTYFLTATDEKGAKQTVKVVIIH